MNLGNHVLMTVLVGLLFLDRPLMEWLKNSPNPRRKVITYWLTISLGLGLTAAVWPLLGSRMLESPFGPPMLAVQIAAWVSLGLLALATLHPLVLVCQSSSNRLEVHRQFAALDFLLPSTHSERRWFAGVSLSAGLSEEILYRNFVIRYFDFLPLWVAVIASALLFGLAHLYQGWQGALGTALMALMFSAIVAGTGSLLLAIVVHALWDMRVLLFKLHEGHALLAYGLQEDGVAPLGDGSTR